MTGADATPAGKAVPRVLLAITHPGPASAEAA